MKKLVSFLLFLNLSVHAALTWAPPVDISEPSTVNATPQVAVDAEGNAVAVWGGLDSSTNTLLQTSERPLQGSWTVPVARSSATDDILNPQVAIDPAGNVTVVFRDSDLNVIQAVGRSSAGIWTVPITLSAASATVPQVTVDPAGNAVAVWVNGTTVQAAEKPFGGSWSSVTNVSTGAGTVSNAQVAVDAAGNATAVWQRGATAIIQTASRPFGGAWGAVVDLTLAGLAATVPQIAVDPAGNALAIWQRSDGVNTLIQAAEKPFGGSWTAAGSAVNLTLTGQNATAPQIGVDSTGNAIAVWQRSDGVNTLIQAAEKLFGGSWTAAGSATTLSLSGQNAITPQVAVDPAGNATVVWNRSNGTNTIIQAAEKLFGGSWTDPSASINLSLTGRDATVPQITVDPNGNTTVVWASSGSGNVVIQSTQGILLQPVSALVGRKKVNNFGAVSERFNFLKWHASTSPVVTGYRIYRDGTLIGTIQGLGVRRFVFEDHDRPKHEDPVYTVNGINTAGQQSPPVTTLAE